MTPEQIAALVADKEAGTPGPWAWDENHPLNACANVTAEDGAGWTIDIATLYGNSDVVQAPTAPDEPWGDHPIRRADARRIARVPDLEDAVIALTAEVARLSTPPDDAEVAELGERLMNHGGMSWETSACYNGTREEAADALTRLSHALAAERAKREAMEAALAKVAGFQGRFKMPFPEAHEEYPAYVVVLARATIAKHGSK